MSFVVEWKWQWLGECWEQGAVDSLEQLLHCTAGTVGWRILSRRDKANIMLIKYMYILYKDLLPILNC